MRNKKCDYFDELVFGGKLYKISITVNKPYDEEGYHYDIELETKESICGNEFQKLRFYLESEGYVDKAIENYNKTTNGKIY